MGVKLKFVDEIHNFVIAKHDCSVRNEVFEGWCVKPDTINSSVMVSIDRSFVSVYWFETKKDAKDFIVNMGGLLRKSLYEAYITKYSGVK